MKYVVHKLLPGDLIQITKEFSCFEKGDVLLVLEQRKDNIWSGRRVLRFLHEGKIHEFSGAFMNQSANDWKILRD